MSGTGLSYIWNFYNSKEARTHEIEGHVGNFISNYPDADISKNVMRLYSGMLGSYLGNLALQTLPTGGLWICGGVAQKMYSIWNVEALRNQFIKKSPMENLLEEFSVHVVLDDDVGVLGALRVAKTLLS